MFKERQAISAELAFQKIAHIAKQYNLKDQEEELWKVLISSCPVFEADGSQHLWLDDLRNFVGNFLQAIQTGDSSYLLQKRGLCVDRVVDVEEFIESRQFLDQKASIRPAIKSELIRLFESSHYVEAVLTGAIGIGKNYFADLALAYMLYVLSCYHNPQIEYDLAPGSTIVFIMQSISLHQAKKVAFNQFADKLRRSPYFKSNFFFDPKVKSELRFPKGILVMPVGGQDTAAIGMNVYGGILDELNFMARVKDSTLTQYTRESEYDQAERCYNALITRMNSRFMQKGSLPGKLLLVSSTNYPGDFTDRKKEEAKTDPSIFVMNLSLWESLPSDRFSGKVFLVEKGSEIKQTRVIKKLEDAIDEEDVIEVPIEYRRDFDRNPDGALRDLAGIASASDKPFIPYKDLIEKAQVKHEEFTGGKQLFKHSVIVLDKLIDSTLPDWELLVDLDYIEEFIQDPTIPMTVHLDLALSGDRIGVSIGRIFGYKLLPQTKFYDQRSQTFVSVADQRAPIYMIDGAVGIMARAGREVDLNLIKDLVLWLRSILYLKYATLDTWQSAMMIQAFKRVKIKSGVLSVDTSIVPYGEVKQSIKDERILLPRHSLLATELGELERDEKKDKVDHPAGGSKDVSDGVAGVVTILQYKEASYGKTRNKRRAKASRARVRGESLTKRQIRKLKFTGETRKGSGRSRSIRGSIVRGSVF